MTTYIDRIFWLQQHGVLFHRCRGWNAEQSALICTQTGWTFFNGHPAFLRMQLMRYNIPVVFEYEGPAWENSIPSWPEVSFEEAKRLRVEYAERYNR